MRMIGRVLSRVILAISIFLLPVNVFSNKSIKEDSTGIIKTLIITKPKIIRKLNRVEITTKRGCFRFSRNSRVYSDVYTLSDHYKNIVLEENLTSNWNRILVSPVNYRFFREVYYSYNTNVGGNNNIRLCFSRSYFNNSLDNNNSNITEFDMDYIHRFNKAFKLSIGVSYLIFNNSESGVLNSLSGENPKISYYGYNNSNYTRGYITFKLLLNLENYNLIDGVLSVGKMFMKLFIPNLIYKERRNDIVI